MKPIVIIPTYNERENIKELISLIRATYPDMDIEILVVDSASPDRTADVITDMKRNDPRLHLISQPQKLGLGKAYLEGMQWVLSKNYDLVLTMDADFSHHPKYLGPMIETAKTCDLVIGSRYTVGGALENWPLRRRLLSRFANLYARTLTGLPFSDLTSGFHCFRSDLLRKILDRPISTEGYAFLVELKFWSIIMGAQKKEIPIIFSDRTKGSSKISEEVIRESIKFIWKLSSQKPQIKAALRNGNHQ